MLSRREEFGTLVCNKLDSEGRLMGKSRSQKEAAAEAIHDELHEWASEFFPMGCSAEFSEQAMRKGLKAVRAKMSKMSDAECEQQYGVPIVLILSLIPTLVSWISMLWQWWKWENES